MIESLALIFLSGLLLGGIAQKLKLPRLIGMILSGILLGPHMLNVLSPTILQNSAELREIALVIILINAGLSIDLSVLKKIGSPAVLMSFVPAFFEMAGTIFICTYFFQLSVLDSAILASILASASPAVIVPRMLKLMKEGYGVKKGIPQLILAGDSIDDILNIVIFTSLITIKTGGVLSAERIIQVPLSIISGIIVGIGLAYLLLFVFKRIHMRDTTKIIVLLGISFSLIGIENILSDYFTYSGLLSVMTSGVIILRKNPLLAERLSRKFSKLWIGAEVLLFVLVGASVNIAYIGNSGLQIALMLLVLMVIRGIGILVCVMYTDLNWKEKLFCTFGGIPKATVQAALGGIPLSLGLENGGFMLTVSVIAILFTAPLGAIIIDATYKKLLTK